MSGEVSKQKTRKWLIGKSVKAF